jgi:solute carrier family 25 (mitochondrial adenine nucleotide translocator), member 4/5/6/31
MSHGSSSSSSGGSNQFVKDLLLGGIAGSIAKTLCAPIERVKLLLQTQHSNLQVKSEYNGIVDCFTRVYKEEGLISFWRGNLSNVIRYFPTTAINFSVKDALQRKFVSGISKDDNFRLFIGNLLSGGTAGAIGLTIVYPLDFVRTRLAADIGKAEADRQFKGMADCLTKIYKNDGFVGLYRGFLISVIGIFVYRAFYFGGYDTGKKMIWGSDEEQRKANRLAKFFFAQFVVSTSETISFPLDTVRRRLMMQSGR